MLRTSGKKESLNLAFPGDGTGRLAMDTVSAKSDLEYILLAQYTIDGYYMAYLSTKNSAFDRSAKNYAVTYVL